MHSYSLEAYSPKDKSCLFCLYLHYLNSADTFSDSKRKTASKLDCKHVQSPVTQQSWFALKSAKSLTGFNSTPLHLNITGLMFSLSSKSTLFFAILHLKRFSSLTSLYKKRTKAKLNLHSTTFLCLSVNYLQNICRSNIKDLKSEYSELRTSVYQSRSSGLNIYFIPKLCSSK